MHVSFHFYAKRVRYSIWLHTCFFHVSCMFRQVRGLNSILFACCSWFHYGRPTTYSVELQRSFVCLSSTVHTYKGYITSIQGWLNRTISLVGPTWRVFSVCKQGFRCTLLGRVPTFKCASMIYVYVISKQGWLHRTFSLLDLFGEWSFRSRRLRTG